jgi:histone H3/H4
MNESKVKQASKQISKQASKRVTTKNKKTMTTVDVLQVCRERGREGRGAYTWWMDDDWFIDHR